MHETLGYETLEEFMPVVNDILQRVMKTLQKEIKKPKNVRAYLLKYSGDKQFRDVATQAIHSVFVNDSQTDFYGRMLFSACIEMVDLDPHMESKEIAVLVSQDLWERLESGRELAADILAMFYTALFRRLSSIAAAAVTKGSAARH